MTKKWKHDELLVDLAEHLRRPERMMWMDMQLGPSGSPRPDIFTMHKSYTQPRPLIYEVKVSVSDFRSDVTKGKWQSYLDFSCGVYFAVPKGLITKNDIPNGCGLIVRGEESWRTVKAPTLQTVRMGERALLKLVIDGIERYAPERRAKHFNEFLKEKEVRQQFGDDVADALRDLRIARSKEKTIHYECDRVLQVAKNRADRLVESAEKQRDDVRREGAQAFKELYQLLDLDDSASPMDVRYRLMELKRGLSKDHQIQSAKRAIQAIERTIQSTSKMLNELDEGAA